VLSDPEHGSQNVRSDVSTAMLREFKVRGVEISFYEGSARVKSPAAGVGFTVFVSFSFLQAAFALVGPVHS
jgi:hypothetical protein